MFHTAGLTSREGPPVHGKVWSLRLKGSRALSVCTEVIDGILKRAPLFAPNYQATYSNMAFVLLGFALESLTGLSYADLVKQTIFDPLGMERATLEKPHDWEGVIPNLASDWDADIGTYGP